MSLLLFTRVHLESTCDLLQSAQEGDWTWTDICPFSFTGVDCLTDEAGTVDQLLKNPLPLGNVLDYGGDPSGGY